MADQSQPSPPPNRRRSSIVEMFTGRPALSSSGSSSPPSGSSTSPNAPQHRRGMSITTMGLTGNANGQNSPYNAFARQRRASVATSTASGSPEFKNSFGDDPVVIEEDDGPKSPTTNPAGSFARRVSFGAQAMRDAKQGSGSGSSGAGRRPSSSLFSLSENTENDPPPRARVPSDMAKTSGEGFNWSEAMRDRTKRSPSFSSSVNPFATNNNRMRSTSTTAPEPPKEMPKAVEPVAPPKMRKPDHLGERMLRGDFMMD
ncbi:uncharacterized protein AB675_771 [Cyphellophora attinorum]|uniref:Uncharacterized protein n=1 Tax=Cyphellophora attinorum TaxID=1664694 RepID=A0A0N0NS03_9EURO|nr:uncharacterized protein AB675_771 [Phialophora attinorum]KPI45691.1 hypothetical protein AB675_771 [Phialophora attinorum]